MVAVMIAMTSVAAPRLTGPVELSKDAEIELVNAQVKTKNAIMNGELTPTRSWQDSNTGLVWDAFIVKEDGLWTMVEGGETNTAADFPAYLVSLNLTVRNSAGTGYDYYYPIYLCWPAALLWYPDEQAAIDALGEEHIYDPSPLEWFTPDTAIFEMIEEGSVKTLGIIHSNTLGTSCVYNGQDGYILDSSTTLQFDAYDPELGWLDIILNGKLVNGATKNITMTYSGEVEVLGLAYQEHEVEVGEVHIFDCGDVDYDNEDWCIVYLEEFEPVRRYAVTFSTPEFGYYNEETGGAWNDVYTSTEPAKDPGVRYVEDAEYFTFWGTFFAEAGSEKPYGKWQMTIPYEQDKAGNIINTPVAYELMQGGYRNDISQQDGCWAVKGDFYRNPDLGTVDFVIGDKNVGMRFVWNDMFGDLWNVNYEGDIFFHNDPTDFLNFKMLPAVGDQEFVSVEKVETEKINVKVVGNSIVAPEGAEVYNLNGVRVNANELSNGLYIVKVGKNAVKVVL